MKVSFKTIKPTGQWKSFSSDQIQIKIDKKEVGAISPASPFTIRLMIIKTDIINDNNPNCTWMWIKLKKEFKSIDEAKLFFRTYVDDLLKAYDFYYIEKREL